MSSDITLKIEAAWPSETLLSYRITTWCQQDHALLGCQP